ARRAAEQLDLERLLSYGTDVQHDPRPRGPRARSVHRLRERALARPLLAGQNDGRIALRRLLQPLEEAPHQQAPADRTPEPLRERHRHLVRWPRGLHDKPAVPEGDPRAGRNVALDDPRWSDERAVLAIQIPQVNALLGVAHLEMKPRDLGVLD